MKALLLTAPGQLEYTDVPTPRPGGDEVRVAVKACGICGSDIHGMDGSSGRRIPPLIMGHEAAGVIDEVGTGVSGWAIGDRVTFDSTIYCGECAYCRLGKVNLCDQRRVLGVSCSDYRQHGAFAEYLVVPSRILYRIPDAVSFTDAALVEPLAVAAHAVARAVLHDDSRIAVIGCGIIGLLIIQVLRAAGCAQITAVDLDGRRLERAARLGAMTVASDGGVDVLPRILQATDGRGSDVVFEAVGVGPTVELATRVAAKGGQVVLVGNLDGSVRLPLQTVVTREIDLLGSAASNGEYAHCIELLETRAVDVSSVISAVAPLAEGAKWFEALRSRDGDLLKVVLEP